MPKEPSNENMTPAEKAIGKFFEDMNDELLELMSLYRDKGVPISELANAAMVNYLFFAAVHHHQFAMNGNAPFAGSAKFSDLAVVTYRVATDRSTDCN